MDCKVRLKAELNGKDIILCDEISKKCKREGFTKKELRETRAVLGVKTYHQIDDNSKANWFWYLPQEENDA